MHNHSSLLCVLPAALLLLVGCPKQTPAPAATPEPVPTAEPAPTQEAPADQAVAADRPPSPTVLLDNVQREAWWDDGDTFSMPNPEGGKRIRARLDGFNTLESYGPVHRWGDWTTDELYAIAKQGGERARSESWACTTQEGAGGYGRIRVDCPELRNALVSEGLAHVFVIEDEASPELLALQQQAIQAGRGMWAKGAPEGLVTSLHSVDEKEGDTSYNRIADLQTGVAAKHEHSNTYAVCEEVCQQGSCMVYVPYQQRYRDETKAECLVRE